MNSPFKPSARKRRCFDNDYGLGAYIHTQNLRRAHQVAGQLQAGQIHVNGSGEAMTPCVVYALRVPRLEELAQRLPALALELMRAAGGVMATRMRANLAKQTPFS